MVFVFFSILSCKATRRDSCGSGGIYNRPSNHSVYQLTDHLGNVRAVVERAGSTAVALVATDYYPFGMPMPNRNMEGGYRYGYQGEFAEKEGQMSGVNSFELRLWDSRIGRWLTTDPYGQYPSPYIGMGNDPVNGIDTDGGLFGRIRAWTHKLFNGGEIYKNNYDQWVWSSGSGETTGNMTDGFTLDIGESRNFGYGGLGKLNTKSTSWKVEGDLDIGILNHGIDAGIVGLRMKSATSLRSFEFGKTYQAGKWDWFSDYHKHISVNKKFASPENDVRTSTGIELESPFGDYSFHLNSDSTKDSWNNGMKKPYTDVDVRIGYAVVEARIHNISKKGVNFDFGLNEDIGGAFFIGGSLKVSHNSSYYWKF